MKTAVVIPTYNEAENVRPMVEALLALDILALDVLIVDDESPDGTGQIADELAVQHPGRVHVLHRTGPRGLGLAYVDGFRWALGQGAEAVVQMDCDFSHSPEYIPQFLEHIQDYDVVVGSRYVKGGKTDENWGWGRWLLSWWANSIYTRLILGLKTKDTTAGFRCWRRETLEGYIKRLDKLEELADSFKGVAKSYAIQAGREIRVIVEHERIDDQGATELANEMAKKIEAELEYPGQIKVTVIRETRAIEFAK